MAPVHHADPSRRGRSTALRRAAGAARVTLQDPGHALDRALGRARRLIHGNAAVSYGYEATPDWEQRLHEYFDQPWPCGEAAAFDEVWSALAGSLEGQGLAVGRGAYGGWDDGDQALARAVWCLARHLRARTVVETGVARGITSRVILEALERGGDGHLWSIDLPALDKDLHSEIGAAVPSDGRARWTYLNGTSRRRLPRLLGELGRLDLFVHDSSHTERNLRFELEQAWRAIDRGAIVADDIHLNPAFGSFRRAHADAVTFVAAAADGGALFGIALKGF